MCMKYEDIYEGCWDYLFFDLNTDGDYSLCSIPELLIKYYGVEFIDREKVRIRFLKLMEELHEEGAIKPHMKDENILDPRKWPKN